MDLRQLDFPPQPATRDWLQEVIDKQEIAAVVPLSVQEEGIAWILGASIIGDTELKMVYHDLEKWHLFAEYPLSHSYHISEEEMLHTAVGFLQNDARAARRLANGLGDKLAEIYGIGFVPYVDNTLADNFDAARKNCDCNSISDPQVQVVPGISGLEEERLYFCPECMAVHGLEYEGRPIRKEKALDANWILEGEAPDELIETGEEDSYLLFSSGNSVGKLEHVICLLSTLGGAVAESHANYVPERQEAVVYVRDDCVLGYLTWSTESDGRLALQQLFVRENYRRQGVASRIIETWVENFCKDTQFYAEEPNEKSRALFKDLGYWNGHPEAVEHYCLRGVSNDLEEGKERGKSISQMETDLSNKFG